MTDTETRKFNRKPADDRFERYRTDYLRAPGLRRFKAYVEDLLKEPTMHNRVLWQKRFYAGGWASDALMYSDFREHQQQCDNYWLRWENSLIKAPVFVDLGCGYSADVLIARHMGFKAYGIEICQLAPVYHFRDIISYGHVAAANELFSRLIRADMVEGIPLQTQSVDIALSHAAIALLKEEERAPFYHEVYRILKTGGSFTLVGYDLKSGYGFKPVRERERAEEVGFRIEKKLPTGFMGVRD